MRLFTTDEIRLLRQSRFLNQKQAAAKLGVTRQRWSEMENKNSSFVAQARLLKTLNYTYETAEIFLQIIKAEKQGK